MEKDNLRKKIIAVRKNIPPEEREAASKLITQKVLSLTVWRRAKVICLYESLPTEVDTKALFADIQKQGKVAVLPAPDAQADLFIVPGVSFDRKGNRLGRGRGFYDRLLAGKKVPKIGLAFAKQIVAKVPHTSYDVSMTEVITEK